MGRPVCFVLSHETLFFLCGLTTSHRFTATHATLDASLTQVLLNKGLIWPYSPYKTLQSQVAVTCCTLGLYVRHLDCFWSLLSHFGESWVLAGHVAEYRSIFFRRCDRFPPSLEILAALSHYSAQSPRHSLRLVWNPNTQAP